MTTIINKQIETRFGCFASVWAITNTNFNLVTTAAIAADGKAHVQPSVIIVTGWYNKEARAAKKVALDNVSFFIPQDQVAQVSSSPENWLAFVLSQEKFAGATVE